MGNVPVEVKDFTGTYASLNTQQTMPITKLDVIRAITTVGAENLFDWLSMVGFAVPIRLGGAWQAFIALEDSSGSLILNQKCEDLERSEKQVLSYWLGLAFAKIIAERSLSTPWLAYADRMARKGVLTHHSTTKKRADLIGCDYLMQWHAIEAKGGRSVFSLETYAKDQARSISGIYGFSPATASACLTQVVPGKRINVRLVDPEGQNKIYPEPDFKTFCKAYYAPIIEIIRKLGGQNEDGYTFAEAQQLYPFKGTEAHFKIGLHTGIYENTDNALKICRELQKAKSDPKDMDIQSVGPDGVILRRSAAGGIL